jgi:hypothetical protein
MPRRRRRPKSTYRLKEVSHPEGNTIDLHDALGYATDIIEDIIATVSFERLG